jgi:hypothetical protein
LQQSCQEECILCHKVEVQANVKQVRVIAAVAAACWDSDILRREHMNNQYKGPILEEAETRECPQWKDISDHSPTFMS